MEAWQDCCECCDKWTKKYKAFKAKLIEGSRQIVRAQQIEEEKKELKRKLKDKHELTQSLLDDCNGYKDKLLAKMEELESLKQLYSSTSTTLQQERDEARKAHQEAQTALECVEASMKQYQAFVKEHQEEETQAESKNKSLVNQVSVLQRKLQTCKEKAKEVRSENKKAMGWLRSFGELLKHPESWTSANLKQQEERLIAILQPEDEDLKLDSCQLEALLQTCASSTQEVTRSELIEMINEMKVPSLLLALPPSPKPILFFETDSKPSLSPDSLSPSLEMPPLAPSPTLRLSAELSDHLPLAPSSEKMQLECPPKLVPATPVSDAGPGLLPHALSSEPELPTAAYDVASQVKLLEPVSLLPSSEAFKEATLSKTLSGVIPPTLMPLEPMPDLVRLAPAASSSELPVPSMQQALFSSKPASPPASLGEPESVIALSEPAPCVSPSKPQLTSPIVLSELGPPISSLEQPPVSTIALLKPMQPASMKAMSMLVPEPPPSSSDEEPELVIALTEDPPSSLSEEPTSVIPLSEMTSVPSPEPEPTSAAITSKQVQPNSMEQGLASGIALSEPAPPPPSLEEPASVTALPVPPLKPQFPQEPAPPTFSLQYEAASVMPQPGQPASLKPVPTSVIDPSESVPLASSLKKEPASVNTLSESAPPPSLEKTAPAIAFSEWASPVALPKAAPLVDSLKQEPSTTALSKPAPAVFSQKPERASVIVLSEQVLPVSLKAKPTSVIALSETSPSSSSLEKPLSVIALSESVSPVSLQQEPASVSALSEPLVEAAYKPLYRSVPTASESLTPTSSQESRVTSVIDLSKLAPQKSSDRPLMSETTLLLPQPSSSLDTKPPVLLSKQLAMTSSLELVSPLSPELVLTPARSEPVSLIPLERKVPTPESEPACKGPSSLASACKTWRTASTTGKELSEECKPLSGGTLHEQLASQELLQSSQVAELPPRRQSLARKKRVVDQQCGKSGLKHERQEQAKDNKKVHRGPASKKARVTKQLMRELFSSSSEDEEATEENTYSAYVLSAEHAALCEAVTGRLHPSKAMETVKKLGWLAAQPEVRPGVVASFVRNVERDSLIRNALLYIARTKANPLLAFCRGEQSPPLITKLEALLLDGLSLKNNGWAALLSSLRARFKSQHESWKMLTKASYVRLTCALCRELKQENVALATVWNVLSSCHAPFLVASAVGAWPGLLSALPHGPVQKALGYILLRSTAHTLNVSLQAQAFKTLRELGPLQEFEGDERELFDELLVPLLSPHQSCTADCTTHRAALELLSRWSPVVLRTWLLVERLGPHVKWLLCQPNAVCFLRLLGSLWKSYGSGIKKLETMLSDIASSPSLQEPTIREAAVQAFSLLPDLHGSPWKQFVDEWQRSP
ncbi:uncharacterized protein LOC119185037 isoform X3 [Rhipicephalus microplus]|uniref:uncharacterized protein LOC119185037 isoform X3 n=1 Tax=Rhipicephalus microplus TaxID=6941 RepID=UPI003F6C772A